MLAGKGIVRAGYRNKKGKGIIRAGYGSRKFLIPEITYLIKQRIELM